MATYSIKGVDEIKRAFAELEPRLAKKVIRGAIRKALKPVQAAVKANAPAVSGQTRKAVKIRAGKRSRKGTIRLNVQIGQGDYKGDQFYASFTEYGHFSGSRKLGDKRKWVPPVAFMRRAYESHKRSAAEQLKQEISAGIDREVAALNKT